MRPVHLIVLLLIGTSAAQAAGPRREPELRRLRVLLVLDSHSDLRDSLLRDYARLREMLSATMPKGRYTLDVLGAKNATRQKVLAHYRDLKTGPDEGLLCFFGGHGATDRRHGHYLAMRGNTPLPRSELRAAMEAKRAGLVVLLSDCCGRHVPMKGSPVVTAPPPAKQLHPTVRQLFFLARGTIDLNGCAPGSASWGDDVYGGVFTRTCASVFSARLAELDLNRDGKLTWTEAFATLRARTSVEFRRWKADLPREARASVGDGRQQPHAFVLRETPRGRAR